MVNSDWVKYKIEVRERLKVFSLDVLKLIDMLPSSTQSRVIQYQLTKSGTSMYANYRAAMRGRSKKEFYSKLCIAVEEADETEMWIDMLISANICTNDFIKKIYKESLELVKILAIMRRKVS